MEIPVTLVVKEIREIPVEQEIPVLLEMEDHMVMVVLLDGISTAETQAGNLLMITEVIMEAVEAVELIQEVMEVMQTQEVILTITAATTTEAAGPAADLETVETVETQEIREIWELQVLQEHLEIPEVQILVNRDQQQLNLQPQEFQQHHKQVTQFQLPPAAL